MICFRFIKYLIVSGINYLGLQSEPTILRIVYINEWNSGRRFIINHRFLKSYPGAPTSSAGPFREG